MYRLDRYRLGNFPGGGKKRGRKREDGTDTATSVAINDRSEEDKRAIEARNAVDRLIQPVGGN